jgi:hypothetical protein
MMCQRNEQAEATQRLGAVRVIFMVGVLVVLILPLGPREGVAAGAETLSVQVISTIQNGLSASTVGASPEPAESSVLIPSRSVPRSPCRPPSPNPGPPPWTSGPPAWASGPPLWNASSPPWAGTTADLAGNATREADQ